jgi:hypothetical protein
MATWQDMIEGYRDPVTGEYSQYNPVTAVTDRHNALMEKRQAENLARMQAANPGYGVGGTPMSQQQFQQFGPPSVMANQDEWLETQFSMANQHLGGGQTPETAAATQTGGMPTPAGWDRGGGSGPSAPGSGRAQDGLDAAVQGFNGFTPEQAGYINAIVGPLAVPFTTKNTMNANMMDALEGVETFRDTFPDAIVDFNALPENLVDFDTSVLGGVGLGSDGIGVDGSAPADDTGQSTVGGFNDSQQDADNPGSTGGSGSGGNGNAGGNTGGESNSSGQGSPGGGADSGSPDGGPGSGGNDNGGGGGSGGGSGGGVSCFIAGTQVLRADGTLDAIENIEIGDELMGMDDSVNEVLAFDRPELWDRALWTMNDETTPWFTSEHPFYTTEGWKSLEPELTLKEMPDLDVTVMKSGDKIIQSDGGTKTIEKFDFHKGEYDTQLYNFILSNTRSYFANGNLVHNVK